MLATVAFAALIGSSCAGWDARQPSDHGHVKATAGGAFETQTLYNCTGSSGSVATFSKAKSFASVLVRTGVIWVKPYSGQETAVAPTSPIPSSNAVANGWARLGDGQTISWGVEQANSTQGAGTIDSISGLGVWCETQGDLVVVAH
jgi:hypothetical protein